MNALRSFSSVLILVTLFGACSSPSSQAMKEQWIQEIRKAETDFAQYAEDHGVAEAFLAYADEKAAINRGGTIIKGKEAISTFFASQINKDYQLSWSPDFVEVSDSGDMGYTYGSYLYSATGPDGEPIESKGIFHTVWKRQKDGSWKFVYD